MSNDDTLSLAMVGMVEGNGHPYSWSAIINGYDPEAMANSPYPVIAEYLGQQPLEDVSIESATVTHIWTDDPDDAHDVASTTKIGTVVSEPEDVLGEVDAVIIPTDDGDDHVRRAKPFVEAGLPVFVDKPLATNVDDLATFVEWYENGRPLLSSSALRYDPSVLDLQRHLTEVGDVRWFTTMTHKTWKRYGIHALEPIYRVLGPGLVEVDVSVDDDTKVFTISHESGATITIGTNYDARGGFGQITAYGTEDVLRATTSNTYEAFRSQLEAYISFVRDRRAPFPFEETVELMAGIIAGTWSERSGDPVAITDVYDSLPYSAPE